jgi:NDP-sugar pyrophosphorylase family protein
MIPLAVLAGGLATRLQPVTRRIPKSLLEIAGEPFISHQLRLLRRQGLERVVLCIGHLGEMIEDFVGDGSRFGLEVVYSRDGGRLLGTGGALRNALPELGERFFVLYGDSYLEGDFGAIAQAHQHSGKLALMTVLENRDRWDKSNVVYRDGQILVYDKSQERDDMFHIDWGLGVLRADGFAWAPGAEVFELEALYRRLLEMQELAGYEVHERFYEIGSTEGMAETEAHLRAQRPHPVDTDSP